MKYRTVISILRISILFISFIVYVFMGKIILPLHFVVQDIYISFLEKVHVNKLGSCLLKEEGSLRCRHSRGLCPMQTSTIHITLIHCHFSTVSAFNAIVRLIKSMLL